MSSLQVKITRSFLLIIACSIVGMGLFIVLIIKSTHLEFQKNRLEKECQLVSHAVNWTKLQDSRYREITRDLLEDALKGSVLFFDRKGVSLQTGKVNVPAEVKEAISLGNKSKVKLYNDTLSVAYPIYENGQLMGFFRLSLEVNDQPWERIWLSLAGGLLLAFILATYASARITAQITEPIKLITEGAVNIATERIHYRVPEKGNDEIAQLGKAINRMAISIQTQMETIRKDEAKLKHIIESMESGLLLIDGTGEVSLANHSVLCMFNVPREDIIGRSVYDVMSLQEIHQWVRESIRRGEAQRRELKLYFPDEHIFEVSIAPIGVEKDGVRLLVIFHNLTPVVLLERLRKELITNVAHEIRTPITSIHGFTETLLDGAAQDPALCHEFLTIIHEESLRLQRLTRDILDLSRIESGLSPLDYRAVYLPDIINAVVRMMDSAITAKNLQICISCAPLTVELDADQFKQILVNLLKNAINYTPSGGIVSIALSQEEEQWKLQVIDTGIGIPLEDLPRIFERFYRVNKDRARDSGGTGLGLSIVKHIVETYHGTVVVESEVGKGTTFTVCCPYKVPSYV